MKNIRRALISASNKTGLVEFARRLCRHSVELISTGGTAQFLREAGLKVRDVTELTGFPELFGGRVKTLHPRVHGGILAIRDDPDQQRQAREHKIEYIDMVIVNLYPFLEVTSRDAVRLEEAIESIDIGGPAMLRSAAKNFRDVAVVVDPADYSTIADEMDLSGGALSLESRLKLARKAFQVTARYDAAIADFFESIAAADGSLRVERSSGLPATLSLFARKAADLRYGENPHQRAALYLMDEGGLARSEKLQGKELSYNNLIDLESAWSLVLEFDEPTCAIIKHTNPCGVATGSNLEEAFRKALATDPVSAFGGIISFNDRVNEAAARAVVETFFEAVIAPDYDPGALEVFSSRKNLRVIRAADRDQSAQFELRTISGGLLLQDPDRQTLDQAQLKVVTERHPTPEEIQALTFAWKVVKHVKSNAVVYARRGQLVGVGAGQMSRVDSVRIAAMKALLPLEGAVLASDAFFPFRDGIDEAARAGATAIIQPGGSVRDQEVIAAANEHNLAMVFTGMRHFKH